MPEHVDLYNYTYGNFAERVLGDIRKETFGEDIGQNSWLTIDELLKFINILQINTSSEVLEVACGSGGTALYITKTTGCTITGIDNNENGIINGRKMAENAGEQGRVKFILADAGKQLIFNNNSFDSLICIDAVNHLPGREEVLSEWFRILKPGGRILFTDPIIVTGLITSEEIAVRSSIGYFIYTPPDKNEELISRAGFELIQKEDITENEIMVSERWHNARIKWKDELIKIEGEQSYEGLQNFLLMVYRLANERRLSRYMFAARKPD
jgi:SAM-dependent methyltransferase